MKGTVKSYETAAGVRWRWAWTEYLIDGTKHQHSGKGYRLKKEAETDLRKSLGQYDSGRRTSPDRTLTVTDWLEEYAKKRAGTLTTAKQRSMAEGDRSCINRINRLGLGVMTMRKADTAAIDAFIGRMRQPGADKRSTRYPKSLSESTISRTTTFLSGAMKEAVRKGVIPFNPCTEAEKAKPEHHVVARWSVEELNGFLAQREAVGDRLLVLWMLDAWTGMRRSEILGLQWPAVNLDRGYLSVVGTAIQVKGEMIFKPEGKSNRAERRIDLDSKVVAALRAWKETQELEFMATGVVSKGFVFTAEDGSGDIFPAHLVSNRFRTAVRQSKLRRINLKDVRSTHATVLAEEGVHPKAAAERLGHTVAVYLERYVSVTPGMQAEASRVFSAAMRGGTNPDVSVEVSEILALLGHATPEVQAEVLAHLRNALTQVEVTE